MLIAAQQELETMTKTTSVRFGRCRLCGSELKIHEKPENICDTCLKAHQTLPWAA
jgi:hypothetical protein